MLRNGKISPLAALLLGFLLSDSRALAAETRTYPPVFDRPPASEKPPLTNEDQSRLRDALAKARDRQNSQLKSRDATPAPKSKTPQ